MLLFRLTTTTYLSPQLLVYLPIAVPAQDPTYSFCRLSFQLTVKIYPSTFILFYMYTDVPVHHYTCSVYFFFFGVTCTITFQLIYPKITRTITFQLVYWGTYKHIHLKINLPVYRHASLSSYHKDLPVTTTTCVHVHRCTRTGPYAFIFILSVRLTVKIYPSTVLLFYMSTDVPVHQYTCSVYFLFFCVSYAVTFQLIYCVTYPQIHPKINLPVYPHASLSSNHEDLPVTTTTCVPAHICTRSWSYLFIFIISFRLTV